MASLKDLILSLSPEQQQYIARLVASMPESEGGLSLSLKNTASQRAKSLGFDYDANLFHGVEGEFKGQAFDPKLLQSRDYGWYGSGAYLTPDPDTASAYANPLGINKFIGQHVMPLVARKGKVFDFGDALPVSKENIVDFNNKLDELGYDTVEVPNAYADPKYALNYETVIRNPKNIRSKFAAFNPWMKDEANLLASHPLASAGAALTATGGLSGMVRNYLDQPYDPLNQYAQYGLEAPMKRGEALKNVVGALPGVGDVLSGVEGLQAASEGKWGEAGLGALGALPMVGAIKASHGSPHAHTKFDFSKIGTGEGAQAYGHGGYFAQGFDSPVAHEYQQALSRQAGLVPKIGNKSLTDFYNEISRKADRLPIDKAGQEYAKLAFLEDLDLQPSFEDALARIDDESIIPWAKALKDKYQPAGHLYNVSLEWPNAAREAADPLGEHHLLDWDAPLSEQPKAFNEVLPAVEGIGKIAAEKVKTLSEQPGLAAWAKQDLLNDAKQLAQSNSPAHVAHLLKTMQLEYGISPSHGPFSNVADDFLNFVKATQAVPNMNTGGGAVSYLEALHGAKGASDALLKAGIPGIRYLDQGSRGTSGGQLLDVFQGPKGWQSKIKVANRGGAGFMAPTDTFTTSMPFKTEEEARKWAVDKINQGTRNYVIFDENIPRIVSRNGVSLTDLLRK